MSSLTSEDREAIRLVTEQQWTRAALMQDWAAAVAMCSDDIVYMPAGHPAVCGPIALRSWLEQFPRMRKFSQPIDAIDGEGNFAVSRASFTVTFDNDDAPIEATGKALFSLRKDADGKWMLTAICWNRDQPEG